MPQQSPAAERSSIQGTVTGHARAVLRRRHERRIDRRQRQHFVTGLGEGLGGDVEADHEPRQPDDPRRLDFPAVALLHRVRRRIDRRLHRPRVTEDAVVHSLVKGLDDGGSRLEIHVGDPERQHVAAGVLLPLLGVGAAAFRHGFEIEGRTPTRRRRDAESRPARCPKGGTRDYRWRHGWR
jgi:hypothetical protein